ncbi:MAG: C40 family peptidase [Ilyomonas sp.]
MQILVRGKIIHLLVMVIAFSSCKSLRNIASADNSTAKKTSPKKDEVKFLDGITVTPGKMPATVHKKTYGKASKDKVSYDAPDLNVRNFNIENAQWLQLKYAIIFDAAVEKLTNLTLLKDIDYWWGTRYCLGGNSESCIDCSAFTQTVMRDVYNVDIPRTAMEQFNNCDRIEMNDLKEGDLVFFHTRGRGKSVSHVGVYVTNNKFVHAATSGGVMVSDLNDTYWQPRFIGAGRVKTALVSMSK